MQREEPPVAAAFMGREPVMRRQESDLRPLTEAEEVVELADGYAFRFAATPERIADLVALIAVERECSPFLTVELVFTPHAGPLWLRLRGPEGTKARIRKGLSAPHRLV
jgi:hypothetical protein